MRIGLVLSGGGARGFAHLGALKALEELEISIHIISGTSSGAIAGAFYGAGYPPEEIYQIVNKTRFLKLIRPAFNMGGLIKLSQLADEFNQYFGHKNFSDLSIPLIICATDINKAVTIYFTEGELSIPLMASAAVPIVCQPVQYKNQLLVDGGLLNNMPAECLKGECDFIIGVHCNPINHEANITSMRSMLERTFQLAINNNVEPRLKLLDFLIEPPQLKYYSLLNLKNARTMFDHGYEHTMHLAEKLNKTLERFKQNKT